MIQSPHRRRNALTGEWVLVSPHRLARPWQGQCERPAAESRPPYDPRCYLCPGNTRAAHAVNPAYTGTYVFTNDFAALLPEAPFSEPAPHPLFQREAAPGTCRVICFSPRHDLSLAELTPEQITAVIDTWAAETEMLGRSYRWVQVFENKGALMGCSNPHPHCQIWAYDALPTEAVKEDAEQRRYAAAHGAPLLGRYIEEELRRGERVVVENQEWAAVVPYWAVWPFETLIVPKRPALRLPELSLAQRVQLAELLGRLLAKYDNLFMISFPYSLGWHGAPFDMDGSRHSREGSFSHWQLHCHIYPPLLRSPTVRKFMVGFELLAEPQRDLTPEQAAARLRELSEIRFREER